MNEISMLFISYSHKDEKHKDYVVSHLKVAEKQGVLETWDDRHIKAGGDWRIEIETALAKAKIAILLVSHHSLTSAFILDQEIEKMLRRRQADGLVIYPIVLRPCDWDAVNWLKAMNLRPRDGKALTLLTQSKRDLAMAAISREIREILEGDVEHDAQEQASDTNPYDEMDRLLQQAEALSTELGTTKTALNGMFEVLAEQDMPAEQLEVKLRQIAERHVELTKRLDALTNDEPEVTELRQQAADAIKESDYDQADMFLEEAGAIVRQAILERRDELDRLQLNEARICSERGELERTRLNYRKAAGHFAEAASLVPSADREARLSYQEFQASVLYLQGFERVDNFALVEAIRIYQTVAEERSRECVPLNWAATQVNLGNALQTLGERESDTERLEQGIKAYQAALEKFTRENSALNWARIQMKLGEALHRLGEREIGTQTLEKSVKAYQAALEEITRESLPLEWAETQAALGFTLWRLGEQESGTERLEQAVRASQSALEEMTREHSPNSWAIIHNNLGLGLRALYERESKTERLEDAITAFHAAVDENAREQSPFFWSMAQNNLGIALAFDGHRNSDIDLLWTAISSCRSALEVQTRDDTPLHWAYTHYGLGVVNMILGEMSDDIERLKEAVEALQLALDVFKELGAAHYIANTITKLRDAETLLAERRDLRDAR